MTSIVYMVGIKFPKDNLKISMRSQVLANLREKEVQETGIQNFRTFDL